MGPSYGIRSNLDNRFYHGGSTKFRDVCSSGLLQLFMQCSKYTRWQYFSWWRHQTETFSALLAICVGIYRWTANSPHRGQWRGALVLSLICAWINGWVNNREAGDRRRHRAHYDVAVMFCRWMVFRHLINYLYANLFNHSQHSNIRESIVNKMTIESYKENHKRTIVYKKPGIIKYIYITCLFRHFWQSIKTVHQVWYKEYSD